MAKRKHSKSGTSDPCQPSIEDESAEMMEAIRQTLSSGQELPSMDQVQAFLNQFIGMEMSDVIDTLKDAAPMTPEEEADMLAIEAMGEHSTAKVKKMLQRALKKDPDCIRALMGMGFLQEELEQTESWFRKAVAAGERKLAGLIAEQSGALWAALEARPYLEVRARLAEILYVDGRVEEAIAENQAILALNTNDNQGIRDALIGQLMEAHRWEDASALIKRYSEDATASWLYARALLRFQRQAAMAGWDVKSRDDTWVEKQMADMARGIIPYMPKQIKEADGALIRALKNNPWCAIYLLTAHTRTEVEPPDSYTLGSEEEAQMFFCQQSNAWASSPSSLVWLSMTAMPWLMKNGYGRILDENLG